jgi:hypothetical protein
MLITYRSFGGGRSAPRCRARPSSPARQLGPYTSIFLDLLLPLIRGSLSLSLSFRANPAENLLGFFPNLQLANSHSFDRQPMIITVTRRYYCLPMRTVVSVVRGRDIL